MRFLKTIFGRVAMALMACSSAMAGEHNHPFSTIKPGADIELTASQINIAQVGDTVELELQLTEHQQAGMMSIEFTHLSGLSLVGTPKRLTLDMADGDTHRMALTLSAPASGRYYAHVKVTQLGVFGPQSQVYAVPVQIGPRQASVLQSDNERVILEADEEIY